MTKDEVQEGYISLLRGMLSPAWQKPSNRKIERLLKRAESSAASSGTTRETLSHLPPRVRADHHHGGLPQFGGQLLREACSSLEENMAVDALRRKDLDDVGVLDLSPPKTESLGEGSANELGTRQICQGTPQDLVTDPLAGLIREVGPHVESHGASSDIGHVATLHDLKQRGKYHSNHFYLYFEIDRGEGQVTIETAWLPDIRPVREQLAPLGFVRNERGAWRVRVPLDDFMGVHRRVVRALELLLVEASSLIPSDEQ